MRLQFVCVLSDVASLSRQTHLIDSFRDKAKFSARAGRTSNVAVTRRFVMH